MSGSRSTHDALNALPFFRLLAAIADDDVALVERLLSEGLSVDSTCTFDQNLLGGDEEAEAAKQLLGPLMSSSVLMAAATFGNDRIVKLLLERGANVHQQRIDGSTAMHCGSAASANGESILALLAAAGGDVNARCKDGHTPLFAAVERGNAKVVRVLAALGANVQTPSGQGIPPFFVATHYGHADVVRVLVTLKPDIMTTSGFAPLMVSFLEGHFETTKTLLLLGAPVTISDLSQQSLASGDNRQLRADIQAWAADAVVQHRIFTSTFLFGCSAHRDIALSAFEGVEEVREKVAAFVGVVVGEELRRTRAVGPAIAAVDWAAHDEPWPAPDEEEGGEEEGPMVTPGTEGG